MIRDPKKIGGTDAAAVLGISPWQSRLSLYERLSGIGEAPQFDDDESRRLRAGTFFEPFIKSEAERLYGVQILPGRAIVHANHPELTGHTDGYIGREIGVDYKMDNLGPRSKFGEPETDQMPEVYLCQGLHYLLLEPETVEWQFLVLCVPSYQLRRYRVPRNKDLIARLLDAELELLDRVKRQDPPDPQNEAEARRAWFAVQEQVVVADGDLRLAIARREIANKIKTVCEKIASGETLKILTRIKEAGRVEDDDEGHELLLTATSNRTFDEAAFCRDHPVAAAACSVAKIDRELARKQFRAAYESCMRVPETIEEQVRVLRASKTMKGAVTRWLEGSSLAVPMLPELSDIARESE